MMQSHLIGTNTVLRIDQTSLPAVRGECLAALSRTIGYFTLEESKLKHQDFRNLRRREFDADTEYQEPRAFGTRPRFSQPGFETPSGPAVSGVVKWFSPDKGFGFVELSDGSGDAFLHGSVLAQNGIGAVQPGETLEVRISPGHKGPHVSG